MVNISLPHDTNITYIILLYVKSNDQTNHYQTVNSTIYALRITDNPHKLNFIEIQKHISNAQYMVTIEQLHVFEIPLLGSYYTEKKPLILIKCLNCIICYVDIFLILSDNVTVFNKKKI